MFSEVILCFSSPLLPPVGAWHSICVYMGIKSQTALLDGETQMQLCVHSCKYVHNWIWNGREGQSKTQSCSYCESELEIWYCMGHSARFFEFYNVLRTVTAYHYLLHISNSQSYLVWMKVRTIPFQFIFIWAHLYIFNSISILTFPDTELNHAELLPSHLTTCHDNEYAGNAGKVLPF